MGDVHCKSVRCESMAHLNANTGNLCRRGVQKYTSVFRGNMHEFVSARQMVSDHFLHFAYVFTYVDGWRRAIQAKERVVNELAGSMIG